MRTQNNFKKGSIELLLLRILKEKGDCYGYQLSQLIKTITDNYLFFPEGSLYPALYRMIDKGLISYYKKQVGKGLIRVYYHIELLGEEHLERLLTEYYETSRSIEKVLNYNFCDDDEDDETEEERDE